MFKGINKPCKPVTINERLVFKFLSFVLDYKIWQSCDVESYIWILYNKVCGSKLCIVSHVNWLPFMKGSFFTCLITKFDILVNWNSIKVKCVKGVYMVMSSHFFLINNCFFARETFLSSSFLFSSVLSHCSSCLHLDCKENGRHPFSPY